MSELKISAKIGVLNQDKWTLFQIFDLIMERWSPIYCAGSATAMRHECLDMAEKLKGRPFVCRRLGFMLNGEFVVDTGEDVEYNTEVGKDTDEVQ